MDSKTYYTIRICKRGELPLSQRIGHNYEHNHDDIEPASQQIAAMRKKFPEYDHYLLETTVKVIDEAEATNGVIPS